MIGGGSWHNYLRSGSDEKPKLSRDLLKRVFQYAAAYRWKLAAMLFLILATTGLSLLSPLILRNLIDNTIPSKDIHQLVLMALALLALPAAKGIIQVVERRLNASVGEGVIFDLRCALFEKFQRMPLSFFTHTKVGEMVSRLNNDVIGAQTAISNTIVNLITDLAQAVTVFIVMATIEWRLTLISTAIMPLFILAARLLADKLRDAARQQMEANAGMNAVINETLNIGGALLVKLFGQQASGAAQFRQRARKVRDLGVQRAVIGSIFFMIVGLLGAVGTVLVYGFGGWQVIIGRLSVGTIVALGSYLGMLYSSLQSLANAPVEFSTSVVSFERVFEVIDLPMEIEEKTGALALGRARGEIRFEHVWFEYNDQPQGLLNPVQRFGRDADEKPVLSEEIKTAVKETPEGESQARKVALRDIDFAIQPGQLTALVGPSGAGKTTLTYLIPRLYDPNQGRILLDGNDLRDLTLDSLSTQIGMVTQETFLFHDTISANLRFANPEVPQSRIIEAAKAANIHDFINELPDKYDTIVGERGYRLSGGEKQRIALARVILKDPRILILDEATSSLDSQSEALIQEALKRVMAGRTSIVIAHRLSTILAADQILVLNRGKIAERGTHSELLKKNGVYAKLYNTQFRQA